MNGEEIRADPSTAKTEPIESDRVWGSVLSQFLSQVLNKLNNQQTVTVGQAC